MDKIPCFLCGLELTARTDKNGKFYLICNPCGSQHFIRRKQGMARLVELGHYFGQQRTELAARLKTMLQVQAYLQEIDTLKAEIKKLGDEAGIIFRDEEKLRARDAVQKRLDSVLTKLERVSEESD
jgi:hypothetical protein